MNYSYRRLEQNRKKLYVKLEGRCQICGEEIPEHEVTRWHYPHIRSKNLLSGPDKERCFLFTHKEVHEWEENIENKTAMNHFCTQYFIKHYYEGHKYFWRKFCIDNNLFLDTWEVENEK